MIKPAWLFLSILVLVTAPLFAQQAEKQRRFRTHEVFDKKNMILFESDFAKSGFHLWNISEDNRYARPANDPTRLKIIDGKSVGLPSGLKAVQFTVPRKPNSYRSEISLPHEKGFNERWYGITHLVPKDWEIDHNKGADIVMQWHAIPGNGKATNPNLDIAIHGDQWEVRRAFGDPKPKPTRTKTILKAPLQPGTWSNWVIHVKWSPKEDGLIEIWKDGKLVYEKKGVNAYGTIGVDYTPYLKTGIYHPEWYLKSEGKKKKFTEEKNPVAKKETYVAKVVVASQDASLAKLMELLPMLKKQ